MTVSTTLSTITYTGNGVATEFAVPFLVFEIDHLVVQQLDVDDDEVLQTYSGTNYSYVGFGEDAGTLTLLGDPLSASYKLKISRVVPYTQDLDLVNQGGFYPEAHEQQLDLLEMQIQQLANTSNAESWSELAAQSAAEAAQSVEDAQLLLENISDSVSAAEAWADLAEGFAAAAETAAEAAALDATRIFPDTATALAALAEGDYFYVEDVDDNLQLYREVAGVAVAQDFVMPNAALVSSAAITHQRWTSPFIEDPTDTYMRGLIEDVYVEGGLVGHDYLINYETLNLGGGNGRVRVTVRDVTLGINVCTWVKIDTQANLLARTSPTIFAYQSDLASYVGTTATIWVNWSTLVFTHALTTYTMMSQSGLRADRIISPDDIRRRFRKGPEPKIHITVGLGSETATHFNSVQNAFDSLYIPGINVTRSTYPNSDICTFSNQVLVEVIEDGYEEEIVATEFFSVRQSKIVFPPFCTLKMRQDSVLWLSDASGSAPTIERPFPSRIIGGTIEQRGSGYCDHIDNVNDRAKRATTGPDMLLYVSQIIAEDVTFLGSEDQISWVTGIGISNGQNLIWERCRWRNGSTFPALGMHTSATTTDPASIEVVDCYFNDDEIGTAVQLLKSNAMDVQHNFLMKNTIALDVSMSNSAGGNDGYRRVGAPNYGTTYTPALSP